jgi:DNA-binding MarR family transcriptional regulator
MTESANFTPAIEQAWVSLVRAEEAVVAAVESEVKSAGCPPLAWYDVALELSRDGREDGLRQNELERRLLFRQYNLSRLLDRMEEAKYIERRQCPDDGRGQVAALTAAGRKFQKSMWPLYRAAIVKHFASKLTIKEAAELGRLLQKLTGK